MKDDSVHIPVQLISVGYHATEWLNVASLGDPIHVTKDLVVLNTDNYSFLNRKLVGQVAQMLVSLLKAYVQTDK